MARARGSSAQAAKRIVRERRAEDRWGRLTLRQGFSIIPAVLLVGQRRLGLKSVEMNVLIHLISFWWEDDRPPFPSKSTIAYRMNISPKTVQRAMTSMETKGLLRRVPRVDPRGQQTNAYDLTGLIKQLGPIVRDSSEAKLRRRRVGKALEP